MQEDQKQFTFYPDKAVPTDDGQDTRKDPAQSNPYIMFQSLTQGILYYTPKTNQYWAGPEAPLSKENFEKNYLPYLRWKFDNMVEVTKEVSVKEGSKTVKKEVGSGVYHNTFPCTPENIAKKRKELIMEFAERGESANIDDINAITSPSNLLNDEHVESALSGPTGHAAMINRLKG